LGPNSSKQEAGLGVGLELKQTPQSASAKNQQREGLARLALDQLADLANNNSSHSHSNNNNKASVGGLAPRPEVLGSHKPEADLEANKKQPQDLAPRLEGSEQVQPPPEDLEQSQVDLERPPQEGLGQTPVGALALELGPEVLEQPREASERNQPPWDSDRALEGLERQPQQEGSERTPPEDSAPSKGEPREVSERSQPREDLEPLALEGLELQEALVSVRQQGREDSERNLLVASEPAAGLAVSGRLRQVGSGVVVAVLELAPRLRVVLEQQGQEDLERQEEEGLGRSRQEDLDLLLEEDSEQQVLVQEGLGHLELGLGGSDLVSGQGQGWEEAGLEPQVPLVTVDLVGEASKSKLRSMRVILESKLRL
jgi:hypothetical protein